jgi:hypothetical protein
MATKKKQGVRRSKDARKPRTLRVESAGTFTLSPPPPPALRVWLETKARMAEHLTHRVELEHIERAARVLLEGDSGRQANPIVVDAVAAILERVADHASALEFGVSGGQRVAAAEALESVQVLLAKLAEPRRAEFVELIADSTRRLDTASTQQDSAEVHAIAAAFVMAATRLDRAFRRLSAAYVLRELSLLRPARTKSPRQMLRAAALAGAMSVKVGAFNERSPKKATAAFDKAWKAWKNGSAKGRSRGKGR